jgi:hypothetical protein
MSVKKNPVTSICSMKIMARVPPQSVHEGWEPGNPNRPSLWFFVPAIRKSKEKNKGPNDLFEVR